MHANTAVLLLVLSTRSVLAQQADSTRSFRTIGGAVTITNSGISLLPTFSLGEPAVIFDVSVASRTLSFEPQFRFALEGRPWSFIFWWQYNCCARADCPSMPVPTRRWSSGGCPRQPARHLRSLSPSGTWPRSRLTSHGLPQRLHLRVSPQVYYLRMDGREGVYATATVSLLRRNFPLSIQTIINQSINTSILAAEDLVWNLS